MEKLKIKQIKSTIKRSRRQKSTISALGLGKLQNTVEHELTPQLQGMLNAVQHLIKVESCH